MVVHIKHPPHARTKNKNKIEIIRVIKITDNEMGQV
jgi:hypothetical protein